MVFVFEITDKKGRKIHLSEERWGEHIRLEHPDIKNPEEIEQTILNPDKIIEQKEFVYNYYKFFKHKKIKIKISESDSKIFKWNWLCDNSTFCSQH